MIASEASAIIPVYNVERYLARCLNSCLAQTMPFDEIILVDDGSTDSSGELCDSFAEAHSNIAVIHQQNGGLSAARNAGIARARGDYLTFIDSDDWVAPTFLEVLHELLVSSDADIAMCNMARVSSPEEFCEKKRKAKTTKTELYTTDKFLDIMLKVAGNRSVHYAWGKLYKRNVIERDHFPVGILNEDIEGGFKAAINARTIVETNEILYAYFVNPESITGALFGENYLRLGDAWSRVRELAEQRRPDMLDKVIYNEKRIDFTVLCDMLIHGNVETDMLYEPERIALQKRLDENLLYLLRGPMVFNRKAFMFMIAKAYVPVRRLVRICKR